MLTDEQKMIQTLAKKIAKEKLEPRAQEVDASGKMSLDNVKSMADNGLFGVSVPEEFGGVGGNVLSHALVVEEIARACASTSVVLSTQALAIAPFLVAGNHKQKEKYLTQLASGKVLGSFGITEPSAGSDVASAQTKAEENDEGYLLNGQKVFITNAGDAEIYVILARTSQERTKGISLFIVEKGTPGFSFGKEENKMGMRGSVTKEIILENVQIPKENLLGEEGKGFSILMEVFNQTRPIVGAQATGIARGAFEYCLDYVKERKQFGKPIAQFQMVQAMLADMSMKIQASRLLVHNVSRMIDQSMTNIAQHASMAKCFASDTAMEVTTDAVQLLGGYGYIKDYPVERMMRDAKITQIYEGTNQVQRVIIANELIKK